MKKLRGPQVFACLFALCAGVLCAPVPAATTINGTVASQPDAPVQIASCTAGINGGAFLPTVTFASGASSQVTTSVVRFQFFDVANGTLEHIDLAPPYKVQGLPSQATSFTCSIVRETLANGTVWGSGGGGAGGVGGVVPYVIAGIAGVGFALSAAHGSGNHSIFVPAVTPPPTPVPTLAPGVTPTPTLAPGVTPTPTLAPGVTPTPTLPPGATPTPTPIATATLVPTPVPTVTPVPTATAVPTATPVPTPTPVPTATPVPTPTPTPLPSGLSPLTITPNTISFTSVPSPNPSQTASVTEAGDSGGTYSLSNTSCSPASGNTGTVASITPSGSTIPGTETVTAHGAGQCTFTFADTRGQTKTLTVNVTTTGVVVNGRKKRAGSAATAPPVSPAPAATPAPRPVAKPLVVPAPVPGAAPARGLR